jgi:hypothetical protein
MSSVNPRNLSTGGNRTRCYICFRQTRPERPGQADDAKAPLPGYLCHHCGRLYCIRCKERYIDRSPNFRALTYVSELAGITPRGKRGTLEAVHCALHRVETPRWRRVLPLALGLALLVGLLFFVLGASTFVGGLLGFLLVVLPAGFLHLRSWANQKPFLPLLEVPSNTNWVETMEATISQGGEKYSEKLISSTGEIRVTVNISDQERRNLDGLGRKQGLNEGQLAQLPAVAGTLVFSDGGKSRGIAWDDYTRRWEMQTPVSEIPYLWSGEGSPQYQFKLPYTFHWTMELPKFQSKILREEPKAPAGPSIDLPLPVQLHATIVPHHRGRALMLRFAVLAAHRDANPSCDLVILESLPNGNKPATIKAVGQMMTTDTHAMNYIEEVVINDQGVAEVLVYLPEHIEGDSYVVRGKAKFTIRRALSGLSLAAVYNALGYRDDRVKLTGKTEVKLDFDINVAALPALRREHRQLSLALAGDPRVLLPHLTRCLDQHTRLVAVREGLGHLSNNAPENWQRDLHGYLPPEQANDAPVWFDIVLKGAQTGTQATIDVTTSSEVPGRATQRAEQVQTWLRDYLQQCVQQSDDDQDHDRGTGNIPPPPPPRPPSSGPEDKGPAGGLFTRLEKVREQRS